MPNPTTTFQPAHYNGRPIRKTFPDGLLGSDLNKMSDKEYSKIKANYESMHPDKDVNFEQYVEIMDEESRQRKNAGNDASGGGVKDGGAGLSRPAPTQARESSVRYDSQRTIKPPQTTRRATDRNETPRSEVPPDTSEGSMRPASERASGPPQTTRTATHRDQTYRSEAPYTNASKSQASFTSHSTDSATRLLEKLGLDEPGKSPSKTEQGTVAKSKLFKIDGDSDGYGLSTKYSKSRAVSKSKPSPPTIRSDLSRSGSPSIRDDIPSRSRVDGMTSRDLIHRSRPTFQADPRLSHLRGETTRSNSFSGDRSADYGTHRRDSDMGRDSHRRSSSFSSNASSRNGETMHLPNWGSAGQILSTPTGRISPDHEEFLRKSRLLSRMERYDEDSS